MAEMVIGPVDSPIGLSTIQCATTKILAIVEQAFRYFKKTVDSTTDS